jgi:hypothetical protein
MGNITITTAALVALALAGCAGPIAGSGGASAPPVVEGVWLRTDGQSGRDNPAIAQQFEVDKAACMAGAEPDRTCMAARGYVLVRADQAEARAAQLRAAAGGQ